MFEPRKQVMSLLFGSLSHAARIQHHEVRLLHTRLFPAQILQQSLNTLRVGLIHLAANRPNMIFPACNGGRGHLRASLKASMGSLILELASIFHSGHQKKDSLLIKN